MSWRLCCDMGPMIIKTPNMLGIGMIQTSGLTNLKSSTSDRGA